jgi:dTDP-glucose 4,6-dehydratase
MKILLTGGAGFIGSNFIRLLLASRPTCSIVNYDKLTYAGNLANLASVAGNSNYQFIKGDILDEPSVSAALSGCDAVVHFAAESHVDRSIYEPATAVRTNVLGTQVLLEAARKANIARFLHASTDEVYGEIRPGLLADESYPLQPSSPYAASKAGADMLLHAYSRTYGFPVVIVRSSNNYGPNQFPEKFLPLMITNALYDKPLPIYGDGTQQRDWVHVEDHCRALLALLEHGKVGEIYNVGAGSFTDNLSLAQRVLKLMSKPDRLISHIQDRPGHDRRYAVTSAKIEVQLGWSPLIPLEKGLQQTIDWYIQNRSWVDGVRSRDYLNYCEKNYESRDSSLREISRQKSTVRS